MSRLNDRALAWVKRVLPAASLEARRHLCRGYAAGYRAALADLREKGSEKTGNDPNA